MKRIYESQKRAKARFRIVFLGSFGLMMVLVSLFLGNPIVRKESLLFYENFTGGWIFTHSGLLFLCLLVAIVVAFGLEWGILLPRLSACNGILLKSCDPVGYLKEMEEAVILGKQMKLSGNQRNVFLMFQGNYVIALLLNGYEKEAFAYLESSWWGETSHKYYRQSMARWKLEDCVIRKDASGYDIALQNAGKVFLKNKLFQVRGLMLKGFYEKALEELNTYHSRYPYHQVAAEFMRAISYEKLGEKEQAEKCLKYVATHGNTMMQKRKADEILSK